MSPFKIILTAIFGVSILAGVATFALSRSSSVNQATARLVVWGTIQTDAFDSAFRASSISKSRDISVTYVRKDVSTFDTELVEALADGVGPDIIIIREDSLYKHRNKIFPIPYKNLTERDFKNTFIELGELFLSPEGVMGVPFMVDPMVMYWNRDIFSNNLIPKTPEYWDEMPGLVEKITRRDDSANVLQSTIALGEFRNINHAKEIITMTLLQAGSPITRKDYSGKYSSAFSYSSIDNTANPGQSSLTFYTQFTNPTSPMYTWNRSLPTSQNFFLSGNLAIYLGFASEIFSIEQKNSNLNFDVAPIPQVRDTTQKSVFGHMYAFSILKQSKQVVGAYTAIMALTEPAPIKALESITSLPPVRRDLLADRPTDAYRSVFYNSALISRSFIDPNPSETTIIFRDMVESITSGRSRVTEAVNRAGNEINAEF